ncbi:MAG: hypothetical protein LBL31_03330 [Spirochaetaceae bacterium]|nr:hypothetical protein [Spirochaetaceae bacterium]
MKRCYRFWRVRAAAWTGIPRSLAGGAGKDTEDARFLSVSRMTGGPELTEQRLASVAARQA